MNIIYSKTITEEKCQRLYKIINSFSNSDFYFLWVKISKVSAWAGIIGEMKLLPKDILLKLEVLDDEVMAITKKEERYYCSEIIPKVQSDRREFIKEIKESDSEFVKSSRLEHLVDEIKKLETDTKVIFKLFKKYGFSFMGDVILKTNDYFKKKKRLKSLKFEYHIKESGKELRQEISDGDIEMARDYPFENLIEIKKHFSLCPFHDDHHASFYTKNNYGYCFSCGWKGDVIQYVMERDHLTFKEAIKMLL